MVLIPYSQDYKNQKIQKRGSRKAKPGKDFVGRELITNSGSLRIDIDEASSDLSSADSVSFNKQEELEQLMIAKLENGERSIFKVVRPNDFAMNQPRNIYY